MRNLYKDQKDFFDRINKVEYSDKNKSHIDRIKDYCLGINKNVTDVLNTLDWDPSKEPKANSKMHQQVEARDAVIDIMKYCFNVCHEHGIKYDELISWMQIKNRAIEQKFKQRLFLASDAFKKAHYAFIIDIDGVLADIGPAYRKFFSEKTGIKFNTYEKFGIWRESNIDLYRTLKEEYRLSGYKMTMPEVDGALKLIETCKERGIVSLLSNRPAKTYPILYSYTVQWLYFTGMIPYVDMIHFTELGEKKYFFDRFSGKEVYFIEDNWYNLINIKERPNVCNIFVQNETNRDITIDTKEGECRPVNNLQEAIAFIKDVTNDENNNGCWAAV